MTDADLVDVIRAAVRAEIRAALAPRQALRHADRAFATDLLPAAWTALADRAFTLQDLAAAALDRAHAPLAVALAPHLAGGLRRLGKTIARIAGHPIDGLLLQRLGTSSCGVVWQITESQETHRAHVARQRPALP